MTDSKNKIEAALAAQGWIAHDGGASPVPDDTLVDLRFHGYDSIRTPPYIRQHEAWGEKAGTVRWQHIEQMYGRHPTDISHWRLSSWREGRDADGQLRDDAHVAFRLTMDSDGRAPLDKLLATWNILGCDEVKRILEDLPSDMTRVDNAVVCDTPLEPLVITFDQAIADALYLSAKHRAPDKDGWHQLSNVIRVMNIITGKRDPRTIGSDRARLVDGVRNHPLIETREKANNLQIRARNASQPMVPVTTTITCPGDVMARALHDQASFGLAFRALLRMDTTLAANGTVVRFKRGNEERTATWSQAHKAWIMPDGSHLRRTDHTDPVIHHYANGHMVETAIGFVSVSRGGRYFANAGIPQDSEGDNDAYVCVFDRAEAPDEAAAHALLTARSDLDYIVPGVQSFHYQMGFWLSSMTEARKITK